MKNQYLCYKFDAQTVPSVLTIERSANVVINTAKGTTFKFQINPSYPYSTNPVNLFFVCFFHARHIYPTWYFVTCTYRISEQQMFRPACKSAVSPDPFQLASTK